MSAAFLLPFQTAFDPPQQAEGSLDPLGLYSIADALGVRLAPGVRQRQSKPRYLTLALVGYTACQGQLKELGASKGLPAWLVFEWLVVQSLVQRLTGTPELQGIPGRDKVQDTLTCGESVCASNYLKTPSVFGFHGIYRVLGVKAGLFDTEGHLLDAGRRVLQAWEREQRLAGFTGGHGPGREFRTAIERAVRSGLEAGHLASPRGDLSRQIADHLNPHRPGANEQQVLWAELMQSDPLRNEYGSLLTSSEGLAEWHDVQRNEAAFHERIAPRASLMMRQLLTTIRAFERLARLLTDAFDEARWNLSNFGQLADTDWLARGEAMQKAAAEAPSAFVETLRLLGETDYAVRVRAERSLIWAGEPGSAERFASQLVAHHEAVQRAKPPNGKRPWFDTFGDGRIAIRPAYAPREYQSRDGTYVHAYRTDPIWSFASDLGRVDAMEATV